MKDNIIYKCRRQALGLNINDLATGCGVSNDVIMAFENGDWISNKDKDMIKTYIRKCFCNMRSMDHYRARILELALELNNPEIPASNDQQLLMSHMMVELGKLQAELVGFRPRTKSEWERIGK